MDQEEADARVWHFCCGSGNPDTVISFDAIRKQLPPTFTLFQLGDSCQQINGRTFQTGWVWWDDEDNNVFSDGDPNDNDFSGTLPDGSYDSDTGYYYCTYSASYRKLLH